MAEGSKKDNLLLVIVGVLFVGGIAASFFIGRLSQQVKTLQNEGVKTENQAADNGLPEEQPKIVITPVGENDHVKGSREAKLALIEYSDYECPFCGRFHPTAQQALDEFGDDLMWVYRHFPLDSIHPFATPAAIASECVAKHVGNDGFWAFTDGIYKLETPLTVGIIRDQALAAGISEADYNSCIELDEIASLVEQQALSGIEAGITGTPGNILLNTETGEYEVLSGAVPFAQVKNAIENLLTN